MIRRYVKMPCQHKLFSTVLAFNPKAFLDGHTTMKGKLTKQHFTTLF